MCFFFSIDNITTFLYETFANLELQCKKKEFSINKLRNNYELQLFIKKELWKKKEVRNRHYINNYIYI